MGIPTHCTLLYGHVETYEERVDHMLRLREQQDETGGFLAFIPLAFHPENTVFERRGFKFTTGADDLKMAAVSRLLLDNIPNIKAYWIMMGMPMAQLALHFGANDVQGTVVREKIFQAAGATSGTEQKISGARPVHQGRRAHPGAARHAVQRAAPMVSDVEQLRELLHPDVTWLGFPGDDATPICRSKEEASARLATLIAGAPQAEILEQSDERIVVRMHPDSPAEGSTCTRC